MLLSIVGALPALSNSWGEFHMSSKTALEAANRSLRDLLERERRTHADILKAKNDALRLAYARSPIYELDRSLPHLHTLIGQLVRVHEAAQTLRAAVGDAPKNRNSHPFDTPTPYEAGASTSGDRYRLVEIDRRLEDTAEWVSDLLGDKGPPLERPPQCGNPTCPAHAWAQPYDAEVCGSCGLPFGKYYPKLSSRRRCKTRSCPHRDKIGQCEHSLLGANR